MQKISKEKILLKNLMDIKKIFDKYNIEFWLDWGTLLGAVRGGRIIEWDNDVDLGVKADVFKKNIFLISEIMGKGFSLRKPLIFKNEIIAIHLRRFGYNVDIWPYQQLGKNKFVSFSMDGHSKSRTLFLLFFILSSIECEDGYDMPKEKFKFIILFLLRKFTRFLFFYTLPFASKIYLTKNIKKILIKQKYPPLLKIVIPQIYFEKFKVPFNCEKYLEYKYGADWKIPRSNWNWIKNDGSIRNS